MTSLTELRESGKRALCEVCGGLGIDDTKGIRRQRGHKVTWTFRLDDMTCVACQGTGLRALESQEKDGG